LAVSSACHIGHAPPEHIAPLDSFTWKLALAYQFIDDVADAQGTAYGKPSGKDVGKRTAVSVHGTEGAVQRARSLFDEAIAHLAMVNVSTDRLKKTARLICGLSQLDGAT